MAAKLVALVLLLPLALTMTVGQPGAAQSDCVPPELPPIVLTGATVRPHVGTNGVVLALSFTNTDIVPHVRDVAVEYFRADSPATLRRVGTVEVSLAAGANGVAELTWAVPQPGMYHFLVGGGSFDLDARAAGPSAPPASDTTPGAVLERIEVVTVPNARDRVLIVVHARNDGERTADILPRVYAAWASRPGATPTEIGYAPLWMPAKERGLSAIAWRPDLNGRASDTATLTVGNVTLVHEFAAPDEPPTGDLEGDSTVRMTGLRVEPIAGSRQLLVLVDVLGGSARGKLRVPIEVQYDQRWPMSLSQRPERVTFPLREASFYVGPHEVATDFAITSDGHWTSVLNVVAGGMTKTVFLESQTARVEPPLRVEAFRVTPPGHVAGEVVSISVEVVNPGRLDRDGQVLVTVRSNAGPQFAGTVIFPYLPSNGTATRATTYAIPANATELTFTAGGHTFVYPVGKPALQGCSVGTPVSPSARAAAAATERNRTTGAPSAEADGTPVALLLAGIAVLALARRP